MIILGDNYKFTQLEIERLLKKFNNVIHIKYKDTVASKTIKEIDKTIKKSQTSLIVLNTKAILPLELIEYLSKIENKGVQYIAIEDFLERYLQKCYLPNSHKTDKSLFDNIKSYTPFQYFQKRVIDYIGVALLFIPTIIAIMYSKYKISKQSPGELLYKQLRVGKNEKEFNCIKIRSMHLNAELNGAKFATQNDPRVFPWGKKIRDSKIDELTQIWNVVKGEMHLVGPRPERKIWTREFEKSIPYYKQRHIVAPGITGLAQIKYQYGSGKLDAKQKLMYDLYYIKNWSLKLELEIIYKTALFVLTKKRKNLSNF